MDNVANLHRLVQADIQHVRETIEETLRRGAAPLSDTILDHLLSTQGKQVRPLFALLLYRAFTQGYVESIDRDTSVLQVVAALELIHMGSLIHDDVIDEADTRRDVVTVNKEWGNQAAVTIGTYVYAAAIHLLCQVGNLEILTEASQTVNEMCNSELHQLGNRHNTALTRTAYIDLLRGKTANLFKTNADAVACIIGVSAPQRDEMCQFATELGILFQLTDDYMDYFSTADDLKKGIGQDFAQGQVTLPLILLQAIEGVSPFESNFQVVQLKMLELGIDRQVQDQIQVHYDTVYRFFPQLGDSAYGDGLKTLSRIVCERAYRAKVSDYSPLG